jgi:hypothetical protein
LPSRNVARSAATPVPSRCRSSSRADMRG